MLSKKIKSLFIDFFFKNGHHILKSKSLLNKNVDDVFFTNSGMVPFKKFFMEKTKTHYSNIATIQRCIRVGGKHNDLFNVGYTLRHQTFFEMMGNFSFNCYFKEQAIFFSWQFIIRELFLEKKRIYITVHYNDYESYNLWCKISSLNKKQIIKIKNEDNFWSMGKFGPCGYSTEIFYDYGNKYNNLLSLESKIYNNRYIEIWNIVFIQFNKINKKKIVNLSKKYVDTGMGLERITAVLQGVFSNYKTEIFNYLITKSKNISYDLNNQTTHQILSDHIRSICFLISDDLSPSYEGKGYILRKIIRRFIRYTYNLKRIKKILLYILASKFIYYHNILKKKKS